MITKLFACTLQNKTRLIFFFAATAFNLPIGWLLKDFLLIAPSLATIYLLSALPSLFLLCDIRSKGMKALVYICMGAILLLNIAYWLTCRRLLPVFTIVSLGVVFMYFFAFAKARRRDSLVTKIYSLILLAVIMATLVCAYFISFRSETPYLDNGGTTLWDIQSAELADDICEGCETDEEKVQAIYQWVIANFEYDFDVKGNSLVPQCSRIRQTIRTKQGVCFDFAHLFSAFCRSQWIPCCIVIGNPRYPNNEGHAWNRVYYNGSWWNADVTADIYRVTTNRKPVGFFAPGSDFLPEKEYVITKIY